MNFEQRQEAETALADAAEQCSARVLHEIGRRIHDHLDPDGPAPTDKEDEKPRRELHLHTGTDGRLTFRGSFDAETGMLFTEVLSPLSKPRPAENGDRDPRTTAERQGDALADALNLIADSDKLPIQGSERPHITLTLPWELLLRKLGASTSHTGARISPETARRLACDAHIIPIVLKSNGQPLNVGREARLVPPHLRKALILRDKGCAFHNCSRPPRWTRGHHIKHWADGGETSLENCVLLCDFQTTIRACGVRTPHGSGVRFLRRRAQPNHSSRAGGGPPDVTTTPSSAAGPGTVVALQGDDGETEHQSHHPPNAPPDRPSPFSQGKRS